MENTADYKKKILVFTSIAMIMKYLLYLVAESAQTNITYKVYGVN